MAKLISWQTYLKSKPKMYQVNDFIGSVNTVVPTLRGNGFRISDHNEFDSIEIKPKDFAKQCLDGIDYEFAVYKIMIARDFHCKWLTIGYKLKQ